MTTPAEKYAASGAALDDAEHWWQTLAADDKVDIYAGTTDYNTTLRDWLHAEMLDALAEREAG